MFHVCVRSCGRAGVRSCGRAGERANMRAGVDDVDVGLKWATFKGRLNRKPDTFKRARTVW